MRLSFDQPEKIIINNNNITINLFHSLRKLSYQPLIILCSTSELYGALDAKLKIDENFKIKPDNPYAVSKTFQDFLAQNYNLWNENNYYKNVYLFKPKKAEFVFF